MIDFARVEQYLDATNLGAGAQAELSELEEWVREEPEYAARYIALMRSYLEE